MILTALLIALLAAPARGEPVEDRPVTDVDDWDAYHDAMLHAADGDHAGAVRRFERLVRELPGGDPLRPRVLFRLGEARLALDDVDGARDALREGVRTGCPRNQCLALMGQIELSESAVRVVPTRWTFEDGVHGFMHPWRYADVGSIRVDREGSEAALSWSTRVTVRSEDQILVAFEEPSPAPRGIRFEVASLRLDAFLRVALVDARGRSFDIPQSPLLLPAAEVVRGAPPTIYTVEVDIRLDRLVTEDGTGRLLPSELERLVIQEVTAYYGTALGENEILLDQFEVY